MKTEAALFISFTVFVFCESSYVDTLKKCSMKDGDCQKELYQSIVSDIAGTGIPEVGVPPTDPIEVKDVEVPILGLINLTLIEGVVKGVKDCTFKSFETNVETGFSNTEVECNILSIKGHYKLVTGPFVQNLLGDDAITGDGNGQVDLEKVVLKFKIPFEVKKHDDGEVYLNCKFGEAEYTFEILGKLTLDADNILLGSQEVSKIAIKFLNEKWKYIMKSFGQLFADKAVEVYYSFLGKFFEGVPAKDYIIEDLTPYIKS